MTCSTAPGYDGRALWRARAELGLDEAWFGDLRPPDPEPRRPVGPGRAAPTAPTFTPAASTWRCAATTAATSTGTRSTPTRRPPGAAPRRPSRGPCTRTALRYPGAPAAALVADRGRQGRHRRLPARPQPPRDAAADRPDRQPVRRLVHASRSKRRRVTSSTLDEVRRAPTRSARSGRSTRPPTDWSMFATHGLDRAFAGGVGDRAHAARRSGARRGGHRHRRGRQPGLGRRAAPARDARSRPTRTRRPIHRPTSTSPGAPGSPTGRLTRIPPHWHPYVVEAVDGRRRFVQGRAADLSGPTADLLPAATSDLLIDPAAGGVHPVHQIEPAAIPADGVRVERRAILARRTDGTPVLWTQRRRQPLLAPPAIGLRFDVLDPVPATNP